MKSEPDAYGIADLRREKTTLWDGIRNYQARNFMRTMHPGDQAFFYHSNCKPPHVAGIAKVCKESYPDHTAQDPGSKYYDSKASADDPKWVMVDIEPVSAITSVDLPELRSNGDLEGMPLLKKGQRLSVQPVKKAHFEIICKMGGLPGIPE